MMEIREIPGKGYGAIASAPIQSGDVVLTELPILVYPQHSGRDAFCAHCLRHVGVPGAQPVQCTACKGAVLCSPACATAAASDPGSHCGFVCKAISACNMNGLSDDDCSAIQYLLRAASLKLSAINGDENAKSRYETLLRLASLPQAHSEYQQQPTVVQKELHGRIVHVLQTLGVNPGVISLEDTVELLNRDTVNGFGILLPALGPEGERSLRGTGLYPTASRINNDCLPNLGRLDNFDSAPPGQNTAITLRALHAIPAGEELTCSYFPLTWSYEERKERTEGQYGFECGCQRCMLEAKWLVDDDEMMQDDAEDQPSIEGEITPGYIGTYLVKFVCPKDMCQGTLCPISGKPDVSECNVCGLQRTDAEFQKALEEEYADTDE